jgi:hypothetical protein
MRAHKFFRPESVPRFHARVCQLNRQGSSRIDLHSLSDHRGPGLSRRKRVAERKAKADAQAAARRATDAQVVEDAARLIDAWNERQARRMPLLFAPTIGATLATRYYISLGLFRLVAPFETPTCTR